MNNDIRLHTQTYGEAGVLLVDVVMPTTNLTVLKSERDAQIIKAFKATQSIRKTQIMLNDIWSREVIRRCITKAGLYDGCKRDQEQAKRAITKRARPTRSVAQSLQRKKISVSFPLESMFVKAAVESLEQNGIHFETEVKVNGCSMRADIVGKDWAIEAKVACDSQNLMVGMAQAIVYRRHLGKPYVALLLPDDCQVKEFYFFECRHNGVEVVYLSQLIDWVKNKERC